MKTLQDYTEEELRDELKRRAIERRKNAPRETKYIEFEATIRAIDNTFGYKRNGGIRYKPFVLWKYKIKDCSLELAEKNKHIDEFYLKPGCLKRDNAPQIGNRVKLRYRKTKSCSEVHNLRKAKIIEIIK